MVYLQLTNSGVSAGQRDLRYSTAPWKRVAQRSLAECQELVTRRQK